MMNTTKIVNSYDDTKKMLNIIRGIQSTTKPKYGMIHEQEESSDYTIVNDLEIEIHSEDNEDLELTDDEKSKISQLIDDFRADVSETAEFDKLHLYETSAKLGGEISEFGLSFILSTGDDVGVYVNGQMMKITDEMINMFNKLRAFGYKYSNTINDLIVRRKST